MSMEEAAQYKVKLCFSVEVSVPWDVLYKFLCDRKSYLERKSPDRMELTHSCTSASMTFLKLKSLVSQSENLTAAETLCGYK